MRTIALAVLSLCISGCQLSTADPVQRFDAFDCELKDLSGQFPTACQFAFDIDDPELGLETLSEERAQEIYAAELSISLARISSYSLILSKWDGKWQMVGFVGRLDHAETTPGVFAREFRSVHFDVSAQRVDRFKRSLSDRNLNALTSPDAKTVIKPKSDGKVTICLDGASLQAKHLSPETAWAVERNSCQGRTEIDAFADALFDLAVEFDPKLEAYRFTLPRNEATD